MGEQTMAEQTTSTGTYQSPYKFNGKELDAETGLYYYGARYYDPKSSVWLSVDPMAEKYAGLTPYNYTLNNPIMFIDPDGEKVILMNADNIDKFGKYHYKEGVSGVVNSLLSDLVKTAEGRAYIGQYAEAGQTIGGYTFPTNGKYSKNDLIIQDFSLENYTGDQNPITNEGTNIPRINKSEGKVEIYIQLMSCKNNKGQLGEIAAEEIWFRHQTLNPFCQSGNLMIPLKHQQF